MQDERRRHPRVKFSAEAMISVNGTEIGTYEVQDLSAGGAFLTGQFSVGAGERIEIRITSSLLRGARLEAKVMRTQFLKNCVGLGVQFLPATSKLDEILQETIISELKKANVAAFIAGS